MHDLIVIEAGRSERHYWLDLWRYRELFRVLAWRDLSVRYKQTVIGVLVGAHSALSHDAGVYHHFWPHRQVADGRQRALCAHGVRWHPAMDIFSTGLSEASNSLINNASLISKVYFPRLIMPIATVVVAFVDFLISFCILLALMGWYRFMPDWRMMRFAGLRFIGLFRKCRPVSVDNVA